MLMLCLIFNFSSVGHCCILNSEFYVVKLAVGKSASIKLALMEHVTMKLAVIKLAIMKLAIIKLALEN